MPAIWNISSLNYENNKKISSKLTFDVGEKFSGRIVKSGEKNDVTIKLLDGWQFDAELDENLDNIQGEFVKFEVEGFEDGKLKLKIITGSDTGNKDTNDVLGNFVEEEGLSKEDKILLSNMLKHNMVATKENISKIKNIITFQNKLTNNEGEAQAFIYKYLLSNGIKEGSEKAEKVSNILKAFLKEFAKLDEADIFMFIENNIDFTKENIESYSKMFKQSGTLYNNIKDIQNSILSESNVTEPQMNNEQKLTNIIDNKNQTNTSSKENLEQNQKDKTSIVPKENIVDQTNISPKENIEIKYDKNIRANVLKNIYGAASNNKVNMLQLLKTLTSNETDVVKYVFQDVLSQKSDFQTSSGREALAKFNLLGDKEILTFIKNVAEAKGIMLNDMGKSDMEEALSKYFGKEITLKDGEFQKIDQNIKYLIRNDFIEENTNSNLQEKIDKQVIPKEVVQDKNVNMSNDKAQQLESLKTENLTEKAVKGAVSQVIKEMSSQEIIKSQIKEKSEEIKNVIKDIINNTSKVNADVTDKLYQVIKSNINDFKVFNTVSNEYYYMDLPLNIKQEEYPCKLIVKDDRKQGKKIDSTNVKMVVSVETKSIGVVDGYLTVKDKSIDVDIKSEKEFVKALEVGKRKLEEALMGLGFKPNIHVSEKVNSAELTNCREFFNDNTILAIDRKV